MNVAVDLLPGRDSVLAKASKKLDRALAFARFAYVQRVTGFSVSGEPEFEATCVPFFERLIADAATYLEFGAGGSTVIAAKAGKRLVCVESDPFFLAAVRRRIGELGADAPERQVYMHADIGVTEAWGAPLMRTATPARVARWQRYPQAPWATMAALPGPYLVLVDGCFRVACALAAARFLRGKQGHLLLDYVGRAHYAAVERHCDVRERVGRMVLLAPRADIDLAALDADIAEYSADWR